MFIRIETSSGVPITRQIMDQIRTLCATGGLASGERLPSVRELARQLAVNQNTILRVYERLTVAGLLDMRHGDGTYVARQLPPGQLEMQMDLLREDASRLAAKAVALGLDAAAARALVDEAFTRRTPDSDQMKEESNERNSD